MAFGDNLNLWIYISYSWGSTICLQAVVFAFQRSELLNPEKQGEFDMARGKRQWVSQDTGSYHLMSRIVGRDRLFKRSAKYGFKSVGVKSCRLRSKYLPALKTALE
jgi:hypothetical protein